MAPYFTYRNKYHPFLQKYDFLFPLTPIHRIIEDGPSRICTARVSIKNGNARREREEKKKNLRICRAKVISTLEINYLISRPRVFKVRVRRFQICPKLNRFFSLLHTVRPNMPNNYVIME